MNPLANDKFRAACYALGGAILFILGVYGIVTTEQANAWLNVLGALLMVLALFNVPAVKDSIKRTPPEE